MTALRSKFKRRVTSQIFISHGAKDTKPLDFLNRAFATTGVEAKHEEVEAIISGRRTAMQIRADINSSRAIFVLLGPHVEELKHTRDWVVWESGTANGIGKDIWVLEAFEDSPKLSVVIPHLRHYVAFHYSDAWLAYLRQVVASYDDSQPFKIISTTTGFGALLGEGMGALVGGGIGALLAAAVQPKAPAGLPLTCPSCRSVYSAHISVAGSALSSLQRRYSIPSELENWETQWYGSTALQSYGRSSAEVITR